MRAMLDTMGEKCFWFATTQTLWPKMLNPPGDGSFAASIYGALSRGMRLALVIPTDSYIAQLAGRYRLSNMTPHRRFIEYFNSFKLAYADHVGGRGDQVAMVKVDARLQLFEADDFLVTPAQTVVTVFGKAQASGNPGERVLLESPTDKGDGLLLAASNKAYHDMAMAYLGQVVGQAPRDGGWHERAVASGVVLTPDRNEAMRLRAEFIETISKYRRGSNAPSTTSS